MKSKVTKFSLFYAIGLVLLFMLSKGFQFPTRASAPGFTEVNQTFQVTTLPQSSINPIPVSVAGGIIAFIQNEDQCGTVSLRFITDPHQVQTIQGNPVPPDGFVLVTKFAPVFDPATGSCSKPNPADTFGSSQPFLGAAIGAVIGAHDMDANTTRVIISFLRSEGGCAFTDQLGISSCCTPSPGSVDLNGDGDLFDQVIQYSEIIIDKTTKNITSIQPMVNTGVIGDILSLFTNGKFIGTIVNNNLGGCGGPGCSAPQVHCPGPFSSGFPTLKLYNIDTGAVTDTGLHAFLGIPPCGVVGQIDLQGVFTPLYVMGTDLLAFVTRESLPEPANFSCQPKPGRDFNSDGDFNDLVIRYIDFNGSLTTVLVGPTISENTENLQSPGSSGANPDAVLLGTDGRKILFSISEPFTFGTAFSSPPCNSPNDLNHNCVAGDVVLQIFDATTGMTTNVGATTTEGTVGLGPRTSARVSHGIAAFLTPELREGFTLVGGFAFPGADLNCDGDKGDLILRLLDIATGTVVNTRIPLVDQDPSGQVVGQGVLIGADGQIIVYEDFPPLSPSGPIQRIHYIRAATGTPAAACPGGGGTVTPPDLTLTKSHAGNFTVGSNGVYSLTVTNAGFGSTTGAITVTDNLPPGLSFVSGTGAGWSCTASGQTVSCTNNGPLAPNFASTITLTVGVSGLAIPVVTNTASVSTAGDTNTANNSASDPTTVSGIADACVQTPTTVGAALSFGANRLVLLQHADGGWFFGANDTDCGAGPGVSCPNTFGVTALGLLDAFNHTGNIALRNAAIVTGDALVAKFGGQNPKQRPFTFDVEFLIELSRTTGNMVYRDTANQWFSVITSNFPNPADRVDAILAGRESQGLRTLGAWDVAELIVAAKDTSNLAYAAGAANRIIQREADIAENAVTLSGWKDTNPAHRFDQCPNPNGCGQPGNGFSFDLTLLAEGALLRALHDVPGFVAKRDEYRSFLLSQQDPEGSWDLRDSQITSYVVRGLSSIGGTDVDTALAKAGCFFLTNQLTNGGWPAFVDPSGNGGENVEVNSEVMQALAVFFSTQATAPAVAAPSVFATVAFDNASAAGTSRVVAIDPGAAGTLPGGFTVFDSFAFDISTTANVAGPITVCFTIPLVSDAAVFSNLRVLHNEGGVLVDRTILPPDSPAPDFVTRTICARVSSLSPFVVALVTNHPPIATCKDITVFAGATCAVTIKPTDVDNGSFDPDAGDTVTFTLNTTGPFGPGAHTVTLTVTDNHGASSSCTATVTVVDNTPPAITAPPAVHASTGPGATSCAAVISDATLGTPTVSDNCPGVTVTRAGVPAGNSFPVGTTTITYTARDTAGNTATATQVVRVIDNTPPTLACPNPITVEATSAVGAVVVFPSPAVSDNCPGPITTASVPASGSMLPIGTTNVIVTATDAAGNKATCAFPVTVLGPRGIKQNVLTEMTAQRAIVTDKQDGEKLDHAIKNLTESLDPSLWIDQSHLDPKRGEKVFQEEKDAVNNLRVLFENKKSTFPKAVLQGWINRIVNADRILAVVAINNAIAAQGDPKKIAEASDELARGDRDAAAAKFESAIEHYRNAWKHAQEALKEN